MNLHLNGKRALVTGSTSGIGEEIAKTLAREGAEVVVHGRWENEGKRVVSEIQKSGGKAALSIGDLSTNTGAETVVKKALAAERSLRDYVRSKYAALIDGIESKKDISADDEKALKAAIEDWKKNSTY